MIYIIRHGQTQVNKQQALQGRSDHQLNETGIAQAESVAAGLKNIVFDHVFSSPLKRAVQTAEIVVPNVRPVIDDRLIEMDYGPYEGMDLSRLPPEILTFFSDFIHNPAPDGMEPLSSVRERAGAFIEDVRHLEGNILIFTHAIAMKGILEYLTPGANGEYWSKYIGNCAVYTVDNTDGRIGVPKELS